MAYARKTRSRARAAYGNSRSGGYGRAPARGVRRVAARGRKAPRRVSRAPAARAQKVVVELVYRDASEVARPQGVVETRKGSKPKL